MVYLIFFHLNEHLFRFIKLNLNNPLLLNSRSEPAFKSIFVALNQIFKLEICREILNNSW